MTKDARGVWSATVGPLPTEFWSYRFVVNGVSTVDPENGHVTRDGIRVGDILLVPGAEPELPQNRDVPHGTLSAQWYDSPALEIRRRMRSPRDAPGR